MPLLNNKMQIERRYLTHELRASKKDGVAKINGYAALFGVRSEDFGCWVEVIAPDAFDACLAGKPDVRGLFNHDPNVVLGRTLAGTLKLTVDKVGLAYEITPPDTQAARDLMVSMERGDITQSSFGFICTDSAWGYDEVNGLDIRTIKAAILYDVSPVTYPAYTDTTSETRALPADMPVEVRSKLAAVAPAGKPEQRNAPNANGCECDCPECEDDDCANCSDTDCDDPNCTAERSLRSADANRRMLIRTAFATS
jgi:hypothetical protein